MPKKLLYQSGLMEINNPGYPNVALELRNQYYNNQIYPKKDKKKLTITNKLVSMEESFYEDKNEYYKSSLSSLQEELTSAYNETNTKFLEELENSQERRDYELTRLIHWENYQVSRVEKETREDVGKINEEYDAFIKIIKDKLYDKLVKKIKLLKEDKVLKDLANVNHYSIDIDLMNNDGGISNNRRMNTSGALGVEQQAVSGASPNKKLLFMDGGPSSAMAAMSAASNSGFSDTNTNTNPNGRRSARRTRNIVESSYNTDSNLSGNDSSMPANGYVSASGKRRRVQTARAAAAITGHNTRSYSSASNDEANFLSDNNSLSEILFGKNYASSTGYRTSTGNGHGANNNGNGAGGKASKRAKSRQFTGVPGLKPEEVNEDLTILESCLEKIDSSQKVIFTSPESIQLASSNGNTKKSVRS